MIDHAMSTVSIRDGSSGPVDRNEEQTMKRTPSKGATVTAGLISGFLPMGAAISITLLNDTGWSSLDAAFVYLIWYFLAYGVVFGLSGGFVAGLLLRRGASRLAQRGPGRMLAWAGVLALVGMPMVLIIATLMTGTKVIATLFGLFVGLGSPIAFMVEQSAAWDGPAPYRGDINDEDPPGIGASKDEARWLAPLESRDDEADSRGLPSDA